MELSPFQSLFGVAIRDYEKKTGTKLADHPLAKQLEECQSVHSINTILEGQARTFSQYSPDNGRIMKSVKFTVQVLHTLCSTAVLGETVGLPIPAAKAVFTGIGILLRAVKDVAACYEMLLNLLGSFEDFLGRLKIYTRVPPNDATELFNILVKIIVELLSALAIVTKQLKQGILKRYLCGTRGRTKIEGALQKLDNLTKTEGLTTAAHTFEMVYGLTQNAKSGDGKTASPNPRVNVRKMTVEERDKFGEDLQKWLSFPDPWKNHKNACDSKHFGTSTWWIQSDTFAQWKSSGRGSVLWIHGKPGAGKTVLCSAIIEDILSIRKRGDASLGFFYCDFKENQKKDLRGLLTSLLVQLSDRSDVYREFLSNYQISRGSQYVSDSELLQCLKDMIKIAGQPTAYLIIDALDECPKGTDSSSPRDKVLNLVEDLVKLRLPRLRICVTSQLEPDIESVLKPLSFQSVSLPSESGQIQDIADYIRSVIGTHREFQAWKPADRELVIDTITSKADGRFRWVFCQLAYFRSCSPDHIQHALDELPETLDDTYARTLKSIDNKNWEYAHRLFHFVAAASRPLRVEELAEFHLAVDRDTGLPVDQGPDDPAYAVLSTCSNLLSIVDVHGSKFIEFAHFSVKEYLTSPQLAQSNDPISHFHVSMTAAHAIVAQACLDVLLQLDENATGDSLEKFPLAKYAAEHWVGHARFENVSAKIQDGMKALFEPSQHHFLVWVRIYDPIIGRGPDSAGPWQAYGTPLHYAAFCGFREIVKFLIVERSQDVNIRSLDKETPLSTASRVGNLDVVLSLLEHGADPNAQNVYKATALHVASRMRHVDVIQALLGHSANPNAQNVHQTTALHIAAEKGHLDVVRVLLENGADPNVKNVNNATALHIAAERRDVDVARMLFKHGADPNARNVHKATALHIASEMRDAEISRVLLENGSDPDARNIHNAAPLHIAAERRNLDVIRVLFKHGADPNARNVHDATALHIAAEKGHVEVVQVLVDNGADVNARNVHEATALHIAAQDGLGGIARELLDHGANPEARNVHDATALHLAAEQRRLDVARILLERGANVNAENVHQATPLHLSMQYADMSKVLLEGGANPNSQNVHNATPLHLTSQKGHLDVARVLLKHKADPNARNLGRWTPLHFAVGYVDVVRLLLENGANPDAMTVGQATVLHMASMGGNVDVVRVLLENKANPDAQGVNRATALHLASSGRHKAIAQVLLEHNANPNALDSERETPLHAASRSGELDIVRLLIQYGSNIHAQASDGRTAIQIASDCQPPNHRVVEFLQAQVDAGK